MEFGIDGAGEGFGVVGNDGDAADFLAEGYVGVGDEVDFFQGTGERGELFGEMLFIAPKPDHEFGAGRVMFSQEAGAAQDVFGTVSVSAGLQAGFGHNGEEGFGVDHAGAQEARWGGGEIDHGRFDADLGLAAIDDERDFAIKAFADVFGVGRGNLIGQVGAGGGDGEITRADDRLDEGMARPAEADGCAAGGDDGGDFFGTRENDGERAGPEGLREFFGEGRPVGGAVLGHFKSGDVDDDGVVGGAAFGFVDFGDGGGVQGVGSEAVNCFRRERDQFTGAQEFSGARDGGVEQGGGVGWERDGVQFLFSNQWAVFSIWKGRAINEWSAGFIPLQRGHGREHRRN